MSQEEFAAPYLFKMNNEVVIRHAHNGSLRVHPMDHTKADPDGGFGEFAMWHVELLGNGYVKLKNGKSGKYLRILKNGESIDANGEGGEFCDFKIHVHHSPNVIKLESQKFPGKYVAVRPNEGVCIGIGGDHCNLTFLRRGHGQEEEQQHHHNIANIFGQHHQPQHHVDDKAFENIRNWLKIIGMEQYTDNFHKNGFDRFESIEKLTENDLEKIGIAIGHAKAILPEIHFAKFLNHRVAIQNHKTGLYLAAHKLTKHHNQHDTSELYGEKHINNSSTWYIQYLGNGKVSIKNEEHHCYLSIRGEDNKDSIGVPHVQGWEHLKIIPKEHSDLFGIYSDTHNKYLAVHGHKIIQKNHFHDEELWKIQIV